jgi:hypothetical protein
VPVSQTKETKLPHAAEYNAKRHAEANDPELQRARVIALNEACAHSLFGVPEGTKVADLTPEEVKAFIDAYRNTRR